MANRSGSGSRGFLSSWLGRLYIAAVAVGSLAFAVWLFTFIGNGGYNWRIAVDVRKASLSAPDRLGLSVKTCNKNPEVSRLVETDVDVQVEVVADATPFLYGGDCGDGVGVQLQEPLGDRDVVDKRTGKVVRDASSHTWASVRSTFLRAPDLLFLYASTCDEYPEVSYLVETNVDVQVRVVAEAPPFVYGKDCRDIAAIQLQEPLGDRAVVDKHTGEVVRAPQAEAAGDDAAEMPGVPAPEIGDAPNAAELEDLEFIATQEGISLQTAIERYGWRDNFSLAVAQIEEAVPTAFAGAEIVDDNNAWIAFVADAPQEGLDIIDVFRNSHSGVSVQIRTDAGITEEERSEAIPIVHYAIYGASEVREAVTSFNSETGHIESVVVLESGVPESVIEELKAVAEAKLIEATRADILDSIGVSVVRSGLDDGNRRERTGVNVQEARLSAPNRLDLIVNSCNRNPEVRLLRETDVDVQVEVIADPAPLLSGQDCQDSVEIQLQAPLGDRDVVDMRTGEVVRVRSR